MGVVLLDAHWKRFARASVGLPVVGTGQKKALCIASSSVSERRARLFTLPALMLFLLLLRFKLPPLRKDDFFFNVLLLDIAGWLLISPCPAVVEPEKELDR